MKEIFIGLYFLFSLPSILYFWKIFIYLEKTKQINLKEMEKR